MHELPNLLEECADRLPRRGLNEQEIPASHDEQLLQQWRYLSTLMSCRCDRRASCDEFKHRPVQLSVVWTCGPKLNPQTIWVTSHSGWEDQMLG